MSTRFIIAAALCLFSLLDAAAQTTATAQQGVLAPQGTYVIRAFRSRAKSQEPTACSAHRGELDALNDG